jgi:hypothetical protein
MTCIVRAIPIELPALFRISGELCLLLGICCHNSFGPSERAFRPPETSRVPSRLRPQPRREALAHRQKPFQSPVHLTRSVQ